MSDSRETGGKNAQDSQDPWESGTLFLLIGGVFWLAGAFTVYLEYPCLNTVFVAAGILGVGLWQRRRYLASNPENSQKV